MQTSQPGVAFVMAPLRCRPNVVAHRGPRTNAGKGQDYEASSFPRKFHARVHVRSGDVDRCSNPEKNSVQFDQHYFPSFARSSRTCSRARAVAQTFWIRCASHPSPQLGTSTGHHGDTVLLRHSTIKYEAEVEEPLAFKHYRATEKTRWPIIARPSALRCLLLAHRFQPVERPVRRRHRHSLRGTMAPKLVANAQRAPASRSSSSRNSARRSIVSTTATSPRGRDLRETNKNLDAVVNILKAEQQRTGVKNYFGAPPTFLEPRTFTARPRGCNADVFAFAAAQVKKALEVTHELGGAATSSGADARLFDVAQHRPQAQTGTSREFCAWRGTTSRPSASRPVFHRAQPKEPTKTSIRFRCPPPADFLREFDLLDDFQLNIETNHATLAGHTMPHELTVAAAAGRLGSIDANRGDELLGGTPTVSDRHLSRDADHASLFSAWADSNPGD